MQDKYTDVKDVESTNTTSALTGARSTSEFIQASDGKDSMALDSTQATSTLEGARSVEQIMNELKEEENAKKSKSSSVTDKWKKAGVNAKAAATGAKDTAETAVDSVTDTVSDVKNSSVGKLATAAMTGKVPTFSSPLMTAAVSFGASKLGMTGLSSLSEESTIDPAVVSETMAKSAPTDTAIATYQKDVTEATEKGANVKRLPFTDAQQTQWNAQDQHRMYSNYGMMYAHGPNEMSYNMALLSTTMSTAGLLTKTLPQVPSFKQKYLSEVQKDDNQMDINNMSMDKLFSGEVDLLHVGEQSVTEDMSVINRGTQTADKYAASDHQLDTRESAKQDIAASFAEATKQSVKAFTDSVIDRGATVAADLAGIGVNLTGGESKEPELSSDFF